MRSWKYLTRSTLFMIMLSISLQAATTSYDNLLRDPSKKLIATWTPSAGDGGLNPFSKMHFWNNGLLVVESNIFSKKMTKIYFLWKQNGDEMVVTYVDNRSDFESSAKTEESHLGETIASVNEKEKTISYILFNRNSIHFNGWHFTGEFISDPVQ